MKKLVGQGKPFYSGLDKAAGLLRRKVGTGSEFLKELMAIPGVKQAEIAERGLGELLNAPKMTHEQFMAALSSKPAPAIQEKVFGGDREAQNEPAHHKYYTLPGGENYREMLIKAPKNVDNQEKIMELEAKIRRMPIFDLSDVEEEKYASYFDQLERLKDQEQSSPKNFQGVAGHFGGEPGILASLRVKDRFIPDDKVGFKKLLHLEELQSDWHQQGREKGYFDKSRLDLLDKKLREVGSLPDEEAEEYVRLVRMESFPKTEGGVPNAPFKKNWEEMALKRLIHHAAENGYHGVVVTPGAEQANRYSLAQHVDEIFAKPAGNGKYHFTAENNEGIPFYDTGRTGPIDLQEIQNLVGKELAEKIAKQEKEETYSGLNLQVGGEGMKGFYDKKVPNILNSIGKKYGVKTELHKHSLEDDLPEDADLSEHSQVAGVNLHYFPITEEMRQDVKKNGIPLYESGGSVPTH